jgi:twitching motility protein PilU
MVLRVITTTIPNFEDLKLPPVLKDVAMTKRGLVLGRRHRLGQVDHARGDDRLSQREQHGHIITIEDPVEYVHPHKNCIVTQREVGVDTDSWEAALKNTLRQAPDVILIGEIRDRETMEHAIAFAETGHLAMGTLHANSSNQATGPHHQLLPGGASRAAADGPVAEPEGNDLAAADPEEGGSQGRVAAIEILLNTPLISDLIFKGEVHEIKEIMKPSRASSACRPSTRRCSIYEQDLISYEDAMRNADSMNELRLQIKLHGKEAQDKDCSTCGS